MIKEVILLLFTFFKMRFLRQKKLKNAFFKKIKKLFKLIINLIRLNQSFTIMASYCNWI